MRWQSGVVMEISGRNAVLLTPEGEFKKVRLKGRIPDIGEEIRIPVERKISFNIQRSGWIAVAAAVIVLLVASPLLTIINRAPEVPVAYVSIDINPSLELTVSNYNHVLAAQAYNKDGQKVLDGLNLKGIEIKDAVSFISKKAKQLGYIGKSHDNTIVLSVSYIPNAKVTNSINERTLVAIANDALGETHIDGVVQTIKVPADIRETAKKKGISPAKYAVLLEAVNSGLPLTEKDMQEKSIKVAISSVGGQPEQIINKAHQENSFDEKEQRYFAILSERQRSTGENSTNPEEPSLTVASDNDEQTASLTGEQSKNQDKTEKTTHSYPVKKPDEAGDNPDTDNNNGKEPTPAVSAGLVSGSTGSNAAGDGETKQDSDNSSGNGTTQHNSGKSGQNDNDTNTDENYMGQETTRNSSNTDNQNMNILKPNF